MSFGGGSSAPPPLLAAPPPPPNPPLFGTQSAGTNKLRKTQATNQGFGSTILGGITSPASKSSNTLLGG